MEILLALDHLTAGYRQRPAVVSNASAALHSGEMVCLLGANGAGKSTLLRTISGLQPPTSGRVLLCGRDVASMPPRDIASKVSLVYTERGVAGGLRVDQLVSLGRHPHTGFFGRLGSADRRAVDDAIADMEISDLRHRQLATLSDGERQKAMIARALAQDTPVILLDEPTAFLDVASRIDTVALLRNAASSRGKGVVMSTHDIAGTLQMADSAWLITGNGEFEHGSITQLTDCDAFDRLFADRGIGFDRSEGNFIMRK